MFTSLCLPRGLTRPGSSEYCKTRQSTIIFTIRPKTVSEGWLHQGALTVHLGTGNKRGSSSPRLPIGKTSFAGPMGFHFRVELNLTVHEYRNFLLQLCPSYKLEKDVAEPSRYDKFALATSNVRPQRVHR